MFIHYCCPFHVPLDILFHIYASIQLQQLGIDGKMYFIRRLCVGVRSLMANVWAFVMAKNTERSLIYSHAMPLDQRKLLYCL